MNDAILQTVMASWSVWLQQYLKHASWFPLVSKSTDTANRVFSLVMAALIAGGITVSFTGDMSTGATLTVGGITWESLFTFGKHLLAQYPLQHWLYHAGRSSGAIKAR